MFVHRSMFVDRKQWLFSSVCVDDIKNGGKEAEYGSHVENDDEKRDLEEPTSFLDHLFLECSQRECQANETIIER